MEFKKEIYKIKALTNMHVGSGEVSYSIIDNIVQKDPVYGTPIIHSSSLKGALREYVEIEKKEDDEIVTTIFGSKPHGLNNHDSCQGKYRFFTAHLLALPVRSNVRPFFMGISKEILGRFIDSCKDFEIELANSADLKDLEAVYNALPEAKAGTPYIIALNGKKPLQNSGNEPVYFEDLEAAVPKENIVELSCLQDLIGQDLALFHHDDFKMLCEDLPTVARNVLDNGLSKNVWYEEVVPHQSLFYTFLLKSEGQDIINYSFDNTKIQIGAGATIGWGYTEFRRITQ